DLFIVPDFTVGGSSSLSRLLFGQADARNVYAGGEITYNYKQLFGFHASAVYRNWSTPSNENAAYAEGLVLGFKPALEADVRIDASPMQALRFSLGYRHIGRCEVDGEQADAVSDLYLSAHYELFRDILVYARLNNLLNKNYQYYEGCPAQGINFLGGVCFRF
ncbi:MAG TPA: TonB-dependent receptor, partial [Candidatus Bacteroides merdavium]|nr:TonB-dependent receptor [Candidatus Bacteroides merdavium]